MFWGRREEEEVELGEGILFPVDGYLPMNSFMEAVDLIKVNKDDNHHRENEAFYLRCG